MSDTPRPAAMRKSSLELFRIITMLFILAHHYVIHSDLLTRGPVAADPLSFHSQFILLFGAWGKAGINCFVLITGYFMCEKAVTLRKFLKLLFEILFYRLLLALAFSLAGYERLSLPELFWYLLPVRDLNQDFYGGYLVFFLSLPFLNVLTRHLSERQHLRLLALSCFATVFLRTVPGFSVTLNNASWFVVLYFLASYVRLYPKKLFTSTRFWGFAALACFLAAALSVVVCSRLGVRAGRPVTFAYAFLLESHILPSVLVAFTAFMFFKNVNIPQSRFINAVASTTFGVLLLHANGTAVKRWLWTDLLRTLDYHAAALSGILHAVLAVLGVFAAAACVDLLRIRFIEKPFFRLLDRVLPRIEGRWKNLENKLCEKCHIK